MAIVLFFLGDKSKLWQQYCKAVILLKIEGKNNEMSQGEQVIWLIIVMVSEFHSIKPMSGAYVRVLCEGGIRSSSITFTEAMKLKAENKKRP